MSFTPKFVDLVRNSTAVQGTAAAVLGSPPTGYTGFADACAAGEQFYYCIQGTDKPAEREVGMGTMQANGAILREPLGGQALTKFSAGAKTISLIAAADWFGRIEQQAGKASLSTVPTRALLAAETAGAGAVRMLGEEGREGTFVFVAGDQAGRVAGDPLQGVVVAAASAPSGANGAWVRQFTGPAWVRWWGAVGDDVHDDAPAFAAAIAWLRGQGGSYADAYYKGSPRLRIDAKTYFLGTTTLDINHTLTIEGEGNGQNGGVPTRLRWSAGTTGIRIHSYDSVGATAKNGGGQQGGDGSIVRGLYLMADWEAGDPEGDFHGIQLRARATIEDVVVYRFEGDGVHIEATAGGSINEGNANNFQLNRVSAMACRDGVYVSGADTNAGCGVAVNAIANRRWGINDSSFLGNSWIACHTSDNGLVPGSTPTSVSNGTYRFSVIDEALAPTTPPPAGASSNGAWRFTEDGGASPSLNIPLWTSGMTVRRGGGYCAANPNARAVFVGCYAEGGQGIGQLGGASLALGGLSGFDGAHIKADQAWVMMDYLKVAGSFTTLSPTIFQKDVVVAAPSVDDAQIRVRQGGNQLALSQTGSGMGMTAWNLDTAAFGPLVANADSWAFRYRDAECARFDGAGLNLVVGKNIAIGGSQVLGARGAAVPDASGGTTVDVEARAALNALLARARDHGLIA